jgi:hypothetical protein
VQDELKEPGSADALKSYYDEWMKTLSEKWNWYEGGETGGRRRLKFLSST